MLFQTRWCIFSSMERTHTVLIPPPTLSLSLSLYIICICERWLFAMQGKSIDFSSVLKSVGVCTTSSPLSVHQQCKPPVCQLAAGSWHWPSSGPHLGLIWAASGLHLACFSTEHELLPVVRRRWRWVGVRKKAVPVILHKAVPGSPERDTLYFWPNGQTSSLLA